MTTDDSRPWVTLAATTGIQALISLSTMIGPVLASLIVLRTGGSATLLAGNLAAVTFLGAAMSSLVSGPLILRYGAIRLSQFGLLSCALGMLLAASGIHGLLIAGCFLAGMGNGPATPASSHLLMRSTPAHRMSLVFSIKQTGVPLGILAAGAIGPGLALLAGWQAVMVFVAIVCIAIAVATQPLRRRLDTDRLPDTPVHLRAVLDPVRMVMTHVTLRRLALCSMVFNITQLSLTAYAVTYLHESLGIGIVSAGLLLSVAQVGGVTGRICWGWIADTWWGAPVTLTVLGSMMAVCAVGMSLLVPATPVWAVMLLMLVFGTAAIGWNGVYLAYVARTAPAGFAGKATGGTMMFTFLGNVSGPLLVALVIQGFGGMYAAYALLAVPLAIVAIVLFRSRREAAAQ